MKVSGLHNHALSGTYEKHDPNEPPLLERVYEAKLDHLARLQEATSVLEVMCRSTKNPYLTGQFGSMLCTIRPNYMGHASGHLQLSQVSVELIEQILELVEQWHS